MLSHFLPKLCPCLSEVHLGSVHGFLWTTEEHHDLLAWKFYTFIALGFSFHFFRTASPFDL